MNLYTFKVTKGNKLVKTHYQLFLSAHSYTSFLFLSFPFPSFTGHNLFSSPSIKLLRGLKRTNISGGVWGQK